PAETFRHLSPEQLAGLDATDERSDAYQLGLILYEMVTLINPFAGVEDAAALDERKRTGSAPPDADAGRPPRLMNAIMQCVQTDREERPETMREFLTAWAPPAAAPRKEFVIPPPPAPDFTPEELPPPPEEHASAGSIFDDVP